MASEDEAGVAEKIALELLAHPLARREIQRTRVGTNVVTAPAHVLGERLLRVASVLVLAAKKPDLLRVNTKRGDEKVRAALAFAHDALTAMPYLWTEEVRASMREDGPPNYGLPTHVLSPSVLPEPRMWWTFEYAVRVAERREHGARVSVDALVVVDLHDGLQVWEIGEIEDDISESSGLKAHPMLIGAFYPYGKVFPDDYVSDKSVQLASVLSYCAFLNSPYIPKERARLQRAERREVARARAPDAGEEVAFVTLRRPAAREREDAEPGSVAWKHRWTVSGHYRSQWYPSQQAHRVIWIPPYVKGPAEAPMLEHAYKVAR